MQTLRDFMRVCSHAKKKAASQGKRRKNTKPGGTKELNRYPGRLSCHSLVAATAQDR